MTSLQKVAERYPAGREVRVHYARGESYTGVVLGYRLSPLLRWEVVVRDTTGMTDMGTSNLVEPGPGVIELLPDTDGTVANDVSSTVLLLGQLYGLTARSDGHLNAALAGLDAHHRAAVRASARNLVNALDQAEV